MSAAEAIAERLARAYGHGLAQFGARDPVPGSVLEAYRIQDLVLKALAPGRRPTAWKVSPPGPGKEPVASPVLPAAVFSSPCEREAKTGLLGVEAEIAFRVNQRLEAEEALVLIELCETRLADFAKAPPLLKLADFQSNGAFVLGSGTRNWRAIDFAVLEAEVLVNGKSAKKSAGSHPSGDPSSLVPWTIEHVAGRGGLQAGDVITTGSWVGIVPVSPGDEVAARFAGIGEARLRL